jgi:hypothetical protein
MPSATTGQQKNITRVMVLQEGCSKSLFTSVYKVILAFCISQPCSAVSNLCKMGGDPVFSRLVTTARGVNSAQLFEEVGSIHPPPYIEYNP